MKLNLAMKFESLDGRALAFFSGQGGNVPGLGEYNWLVHVIIMKLLITSTFSTLFDIPSTNNDINNNKTLLL